MTESCYSLLYFAQHIGCCHLLTSKVSRMWLLVHNKVYFCYNLIFHCTLLSRPNQFYWHVFTPEHHLEESLAVCSCLLLFSYYSSCMFYQLRTLWRQSRGRVTFGVQWLVATGKQRVFFKCLSTTAISVQHCSFQVIVNQSHPILLSC